MNVRRVWITSVCFAVSTAIPWCSIAAPAQSADSASIAEKLSKEVRHILNTMTFTEYSHKIQVDEKQGRYSLDCSELVCYVLEHTFPKHYTAITAGKGHARPHAGDFYHFFLDLPSASAGRIGWQRMTRLMDARPGDILAWAAYNAKTHSTGHVVFVDSVPVRLKDGQIRLEIIDSTGHGHGNDTRKPGQTGIGRGTMWFTTDDQGQPNGYHWSRPNGKHQLRAIAVGRPVKIVSR